MSRLLRLKDIVYNLFVSILNVGYAVPWKLDYLAARRRSSGRPRVVLFYPGKPDPHHSIYKVLHRLGWWITSDLREPADLVMRFEPATFGQENQVLAALESRYPVINVRCLDISKQRVEAVFCHVFGYGSQVDPSTYAGQCVCKSNDNALHDGRKIHCPVVPEPGRFYQVLVNNVDNGLVQDIRVPIVGNCIPLVFVKYRPAATRFAVLNSRVEARETPSALTDSEVSLLLEFAACLGLDYGELDVLRDKDSDRLYVVDAANTPWGPPNHLARADADVAIQRLAEAFRDQFLPER